MQYLASPKSHCIFAVCCVNGILIAYSPYIPSTYPHCIFAVCCVNVITLHIRRRGALRAPANHRRRRARTRMNAMAFSACLPRTKQIVLPAGAAQARWQRAPCRLIPHVRKRGRPCVLAVFISCLCPCRHGCSSGPLRRRWDRGTVPLSHCFFLFVNRSDNRFSVLVQQWRQSACVAAGTKQIVDARFLVHPDLCYIQFPLCVHLLESIALEHSVTSSLNSGRGSEVRRRSASR